MAPGGAPGQDAAGAPPILPDPEKVPEKVAEEILRQAQKLIETQIAASNALDAKLNALIQQCITLTLAALAGVGTAFAGGAWLPVSAAVGLLASALLWSLAAVMALRALNTSEIDAPARRPRRLWRSGIADVGTVKTFALIAAELDGGFARNSLRATRTAYRYKAALTVMVIAPLAGLVAAAGYVLVSLAWWPIPILLLLGPFLLSRLWKRYRSWMRNAEGLDDDVSADRIG